MVQFAGGLKVKAVLVGTAQIMEKLEQQITRMMIIMRKMRRWIFSKDDGDDDVILEGVLMFLLLIL